MTKAQHSLLFISMQEVMATESPEDYAQSQAELTYRIENQSEDETKVEIMGLVLGTSEMNEVEDEARAMTGSEPDSELDFEQRVDVITDELLVRMYDKGEAS